MENTRTLKHIGVGDAAVEGLLDGILAGIVMGGFILLLEVLAGANLFAILNAFDITGSASPLTGVFTHFAVAGIYGVTFGIAALALARLFGARLTRILWLVVGALYGLLLFGIAVWFILPTANPLLAALPPWQFATAHIMYGIVLAWLFVRNK